MPVPSDTELIHPLFSILLDKRECGIKDLSEQLARHFLLTVEEKNRLIHIPEGFANRSLNSFDQHIGFCILKMINLDFVECMKGPTTFNANYISTYKLTETGVVFYEQNNGLSASAFGTHFEAVSRQSMEYLNGKGNQAPSDI